MKTSKILIFLLLLSFIGASSALAEMSTQVGVGYGKQFRDDKDLEQYELLWRHPLSYSTTLWDSWNVSTDIELGLALLREANSDKSETGRFSVMPQVMLSPNDMVNFIAGFGAGFMVGETEFTKHDLGGPFLFNSKLGVQLVLGGHWGLEYDCYHQSNAGIYERNASLNMNQFSLTYNF